MAYVQGAVGGTGGTSATAVFGSNVTAGNLIVVSFYLNENGTVSSVADGLGNTYTLVDSIENNNNGVMHYKYHAENISGGACTITVTMTASRLIHIAAEEYSGMETSGALDQTAKAQSASTTPSSGNLTTTTANQLLHCSVAIADGATASVGTDFTFRQQQPSDSTGRVATEDRTVASTGTYSGGFTLDPSRDWACILASFKEAAGGGGGEEPPVIEDTGQPFHRRFWGIPGHAGYSIGGHVN